MNRLVQAGVVTCSLDAEPIQICITQNIILNILYLAPLKESVAASGIQIYKSPKMKATDNILVNKYRAILDAQRETLNFKNWTQGTILRKLNGREAHLNKLRSEERDLEEYIKEYNTSDLVLIYKSSFNEEWKVFHRSKICYMEFPDQERVIHNNISGDNVKIAGEHDGEGHSNWGIEYRRHGSEDGSLRAKLYTTRACFYREPLSTHKSRLDQLREILDSNWLYTQLISRLSDEKLTPEVFLRLVDEKAYARTLSENRETVESVYHDIIRNDKTELLEQATM
ncbi:hypothetical protein BGX26_010419 [Mortierella sp. AD094]|nr:hypothetical protein BGX26_010419 [Mortierella sp. AD094]